MLLIQVYLAASCITAGVLQILRSTRRITAIPGGTIIIASFDAAILGTMIRSSSFAFAIYEVATIVLGFGALAWLVSGVVGLFTGPLEARRRAEADAAMTRLRVAEEGEA